MTMFEPLQPTLWPETELARSTSSRAASRAKTLALQESALASRKEPAADCGPKSSDLLASYDPTSSSWRTSQTCLMALLNSQGHGLAEFSGTWPSAGMMQSGKTYRRQPWALPIAESVSGLWLTPTVQDSSKATKRWRESRQNNLTAQVFTPKMWPTPAKSNAKGAVKKRFFGSPDYRSNLDEAVRTHKEDGQLNPTWVEWLMGFPTGWTDLQP